MNRVQTHFLPANQVIAAAQRSLIKTLGQVEGPTLLLLSGGSIVGFYSVLRDLIEKDEGHDLYIGLIDERYGPVGHANSNVLAIERQTRLFSAAKAHGIEVRTINTDQTIESQVASYQEWLQRAMKTCRTTIGILGVGMDGHVAGIKPNNNDLVFSSLFENKNKLVVSYESTDFGERITVTLPLLWRLDTVLVVAPGEGKRSIIDQALTTADQPLYEMPARILPRLQHVELFAAE